MTDTKPLVMLVEDDPPLIDIYRIAMKRSPFKLSIQSDIDDAFNFARDKHPSLILLDIILPAAHHQAPAVFEKMGFELLKKLKGDSKTKNIPVVMFTNLDSYQDRETAENLGAVDYLVKANYVPSKTIKKIEEVLAKLPADKK